MSYGQMMMIDPEDYKLHYGLRFKFDWMEVPFTDDNKIVESVFETLNNTHTGVFYGFVLLCMIVFSSIHLFRKYYVRRQKLRNQAPFFRNVGRRLRKFFMRQGYLGLPTRAHFLVAMLYCVVNFWVCAFSAQPKLLMIQLARRCGWFSIINATLMVFLAMKNTPLSYLTGLSYEKLNVFHRWVAIMALVQGAVHTVAVAVGLSRLIPSQVGFLLVSKNVWGIIVLALWLIVLASFYLLKRIRYEVFYIMHLVLFPLIFIGCLLHNHYCYIPIGVGLAIYVIDRLIRLNRMYWHNRYADKLKATITLTQDGMTNIKIPRGNLMWMPGTHAFLNIPRVRYFESHPFSIASVGDDIDTEGGKKTVDFIIKPEDGFTRAMNWHAQKVNTEKRQTLQTRELTAYIDGPYGALPNFNEFDKVLLYASGSGITYTLPIALSIVRKARVKHLEFVWSTKKAMSYENIRPQLEELARGNRGGAEDQQTHVIIRLHETDPEKKRIWRSETMMNIMGKAADKMMGGLRPGHHNKGAPQQARGRSAEPRGRPTESSSLLSAPEEPVPPMPHNAHLAARGRPRAISGGLMPSQEKDRYRLSTISGETYLVSRDNSPSPSEKPPTAAKKPPGRIPIVGTQAPGSPSPLPSPLFSGVSSPEIVTPPLQTPPSHGPIHIRRTSGYFRAPLAQEVEHDTGEEEEDDDDDDDFKNLYDSKLQRSDSDVSEKRGRGRGRGREPRDLEADSDDDGTLNLNDFPDYEEDDPYSNPRHSTESHRARLDSLTDEKNPLRKRRSTATTKSEKRLSGVPDNQPKDVLDQFIRSGRPNMERIVENFITGADEGETCAIASCGPGSTSVRKFATDNMTSGGPSVSLFVEEFGW